MGPSPTRVQSLLPIELRPTNDERKGAPPFLDYCDGCSQQLPASQAYLCEAVNP